MHRLYKYAMLTLSYSIALLLFLSFFQYIKDRLSMYNLFIYNLLLAISQGLYKPE